MATAIAAAVEPRVESAVQLERLRDAIESAASDPAERSRLMRAHATVCVEVAGEGSLMIRLDRDEIAVLDVLPHPDIVISLGPDQLAAALDGRGHLPIMIARGEISATGPVRRFLLLIPILRRLVASTA